jgi:hypothetical protein
LSYEDGDHENTLRDILVLNLFVGILTKKDFYKRCGYAYAIITWVDAKESNSVK